MGTIGNIVSVPFTSGSSLQRPDAALAKQVFRFQFPLHRDPRCNKIFGATFAGGLMFQFPLHRDPRCNGTKVDSARVRWKFQFPLHRDPRCNVSLSGSCLAESPVSVPFTSGSSLQLTFCSLTSVKPLFQFPLHRDPRCNFVHLRQGVQEICFSSLYIGILAATSKPIRCYWRQVRFQFPLHRDPRCNTCPAQVPSCRL